MQACCGAGGQGNYNFNLKKKCGEEGASVCSNPSSYVSWDGIHMTEAAYRYVANGWLNGPYAEPPILKWEFEGFWLYVTQLLVQKYIWMKKVSVIEEIKLYG